MSGAAVKQKGCVRMNKFDTMSKDALSKMEELICHVVDPKVKEHVVEH